MRFVSRTAVLAGFFALGAHTLLSCSSEEPKFLYEDGSEVAAQSSELGSMKLALTAGGVQVDTVTAVISAKHGFHTQTHNIDVSDANGIISIFFGGLPVGRGYSIELKAGACSGTSDFSIQADQTTLVSVVLKCPGSDDQENKETGSVSVTGVIQGGGNPNAGCDHIKRIVAAPSVQDGDGPTSTVEVVLNKGETASSITWTTGSTTGGAGVISNQSGAADTQVSFDCTANGIVYVIANVVGSGSDNCTEQARAAVDCRNQNCGNGVINPPEQCDGSVPAGQPAGTTCVNCVLVPPSSQVTCNNNNTIDAGEQCDGTALPATAPLGATCSQCQIVHHCGNSVIDSGEQCDGTTFLPTAPLGATCTSRCQEQDRCNNGVINPGEQCDGTARPTGVTGGTCDARCVCTGCQTTGTGPVCGNNLIESPEVCDGTALPATAPLGATCTNCTAIASQCGNGVVNPPEQCDGTARPTNTTGGTCDNRCVLTGGTTTQPPTCGNNTIEGTEPCDGTALPTTAPLGATCVNCTLQSQCGNNVVNPPEQCDGAARPTGTTGGTCDSRCVLTGGTTTQPQTCGNNIIEGTEACDGTALPSSAPVGSTCANCVLVPPTTASVCQGASNNKIEGKEECDGTALGQEAAAGATCSGCTLSAAKRDAACKACAEASCADKRADVNANLAAVKPVLDCMLGSRWQSGAPAPIRSCVNGELLSCYCGSLAGQDCANAAPSALTGQCVQEVLTGTACTVSSCVAPIFLNPTNSTGKATQYVQCLGDFCYNECLTDPASLPAQ